MQQHNETESTNLLEILILAFIWLALLASPLIVWRDKDGLSWQVILDTWLRLIPFLALTLLNHFVLVPLFFFKKMSRYFAIAAVTLVMFSAGFSFMQNHKNNQPPGRNDKRMLNSNPPDKPLPEDWETRQDFLPPRERIVEPGRHDPGNLPPYLNTFMIAFLIMGFDTGMRSIFKTTKTEQEKEKLEKEKVKSELAFLRNQISPHFFMNTLNNIHSLIDLDTEGAKDAVIRLSKLMQHLLYESERELISLDNEIAFIQSYIELMKLRFTEKVKVTVNIQSDQAGVMIPPLLFTSLLENAFKYGVSYQEKSFIDISLHTLDGNLVFKISNSIISRRKQVADDRNSGIGLGNTRKRLELLYAERYQMHVSDTDGVFTVNLTLPL